MLTLAASAAQTAALQRTGAFRTVVRTAACPGLEFGIDHEDARGLAPVAGETIFRDACQFCGISRRSAFPGAVYDDERMVELESQGLQEHCAMVEAPRISLWMHQYSKFNRPDAERFVPSQQLAVGALHHLVDAEDQEVLHSSTPLAK